MNKTWINVKDKLPEYGQYVLVIYNGGNWIGRDKKHRGMHNVLVAQLEKDKSYRDNDGKPYPAPDRWRYGCYHHLRWNYVSYWAPIPDLPEDELVEPGPADFDTPWVRDCAKTFEETSRKYIKVKKRD